MDAGEELPPAANLPNPELEVELIAARTLSQEQPVAERTRNKVGNQQDMTAFADVHARTNMNEWLQEIAFVTGTMSDPEEPQTFQ